MRRWMWREGRAAVRRGRRGCTTSWNDEIDAMPGLRVFRPENDPRLAGHRRDPLRLVVNVSGTGWSGYEVEQYLRTEFQVEDEMADWFNVVYILSPHDDPAATRAVAGGVAVGERQRRNRGRGRPGSRTSATRRTCCSRRFRRWRCRREMRPWRRQTIVSLASGRWPNLCRNGYVLSTGHSAADAGRSRSREETLDVCRQLLAAGRQSVRQRSDVRNDPRGRMMRFRVCVNGNRDVAIRH